MPRRPLGIIDLVALVALCALDAGWVRFLSDSPRSLCGLWAPGFDIGVIVMGTVLTALGWLAYRRCLRATPGRVGFATAGVLTLGVYLYLGRYRGEWVRWYVTLIYPFSTRMGFDPHASRYLYIGNALMILPPFLLMAGLGGLAGRIVGTLRSDRRRA